MYLGIDMPDGNVDPTSNSNPMALLWELYDDMHYNRGKYTQILSYASRDSFKTLGAAIKAADLEGTLKGAGPFTVFAPTDEAFAKLPAGTVEGLLKPENKDKLKAILTFHVVSGKVEAAAAMKLTTAKTVNGKELKLDASSGSLHVGKATVTKADIQASNGVIHVIDKVLMPA